VATGTEEATLVAPEPGSSPDERAAAGKAARGDAPRSSHGDWEPAADRPDPVEVLESQAESRVPELVPIRYGRMLASPFAFFRGAAAVMAADLAPTPRSGFRAQICGDAHLSNFGAFGAPDRDLLFDINDFDETHPGPWEWDLKRLGASFSIAGRERGFDRGQRDTLVETAARGYREAMRGFAGMRNIDVWYQRLDISRFFEAVQSSLRKKQRKGLQRGIAKARAKTSLRAFSKLTRQSDDGEVRIISDPPLIVPLEDLFEGVDQEQAERWLDEVIASYGSTLPDDTRHLFDSYRLIDVARKVVGVGSVGTRAWIALFLGHDGEDPLFLQIKEAEQSVLEPYTEPSEYEEPGERVVKGQRLMQAAGDIFLGWFERTDIDGVPRHYYVRQLWDQKGSMPIEQMEPEQMENYATACGWTLARAHARSGDRAAIAGYLGGGNRFDRALAQFAEAYAEQNERDYAALKRAVEGGAVAAETGV
jgi:uncharacterized protein (DUF2252 family)